MDEIKTKKKLRTSSAFLDIPTEVSQFAVPKKIANLSSLGSPTSATSLGQLSMTSTKKNIYSHVRSQRGSKMMSVL